MAKYLASLSVHHGLSLKLLSSLNRRRALLILLSQLQHIVGIFDYPPNAFVTPGVHF